MGLIRPTRARQRPPRERRARADEAAGDVLVGLERVSPARHHLSGTCPHCHKPQVVESATTWVTTKCSYCGAAITVHS